MKTFIITYVTELGTRVKERIDAVSMQVAIRIYLQRQSAKGLDEAVSFNIIKLQVN